MQPIISRRSNREMIGSGDLIQAGNPGSNIDIA